MNKKIPIVVMKFGGVALADDQNMQKATDIIISYKKNAHPVVIVSAVKGITDTLYTIIKLIQLGNIEQALLTIDTIYRQHSKLLHVENSIETFETKQQLQSLIDLLKLYLKKKT